MCSDGRVMDVLEVVSDISESGSAIIQLKMEDGIDWQAAFTAAFDTFEQLASLGNKTVVHRCGEFRFIGREGHAVLFPHVRSRSLC